MANCNKTRILFASVQNVESYRFGLFKLCSETFVFTQIWILPRTKARIVEYYVTNSNTISFVDVLNVRIA